MQEIVREVFTAIINPLTNTSLESNAMNALPRLAAKRVGLFHGLIHPRRN